jgi:hypothetical protein
MTNLDFEAWRCCKDDTKFCPDEGCPKSYGCACLREERDKLRATMDAAIRILSDDRLPLQSRVNDARSILAH